MTTRTPSIWLKAPALCQSIDKNQALVDGNKRLVWLSTKVFFAFNGYRLTASADDGERFILDLVARTPIFPGSPTGSTATARPRHHPTCPSSQPDDQTSWFVQSNTAGGGWLLLAFARQVRTFRCATIET
jgi:hypothetical protein